MWLLDSTWNMHDGMGWWMIWGAAMMALFWGTVIALAIWGVTRFSRGEQGDENAPLEIARRRYAQGEISRDEFEQLRQDLA